jgi:hypothetical protein
MVVHSLSLLPLCESNMHFYWLFSHFDYTNFRASLVIEIINFDGIKYMAHLAMLVIFHVNVIICQNFSLPHIYHILAK